MAYHTTPSACMHLMHRLAGYHTLFSLKLDIYISTNFRYLHINKLQKGEKDITATSDLIYGPQLHGQRILLSFFFSFSFFSIFYGLLDSLHLFLLFLSRRSLASYMSTWVTPPWRFPMHYITCQLEKYILINFIFFIVIIKNFRKHLKEQWRKGLSSLVDL